MLTVTRISCDRFVERLVSLRETLADRDPKGVNLALRSAIAHNLFLYHDQMRSADRPFDRAAFAARLEDVTAVADRAEPVRPGSAGQTLERQPYETYVADLYSRCWAKYADGEFLATIGFFEERLRMNGVDMTILQGAECLDAGCGSGRYTMAMARAGARAARGIDISDRAVGEARDRAERLGYGSRVTFDRGSVIDLPAEWTGRFDFVCSNGVVHHTPDPIKGLREIARVLKPGGHAFVMVYGKGGLFWALTDFVRDILQTVPLDFADVWLQAAGTPIGKIFFCLDHWYTPYQERVDRQEFESRLRDAGFDSLRYLPRARVYDSSERLHRYPEESDLIGSPDVRYLVRKPL